MKKFFLLLVVIPSIHLSCTKCGCDMPPPLTSRSIFSFNLVVKNIAGQDLLNPEISGGYKKEEIKLYNQKADGSKKAITFTINKPLIAGNDKLDYFQLNSSQIMPSQGEKKDITYLQFRDETPYIVDLLTTSNFGGNRSDFMELSINYEQIERDVTLKEYINALFYFTKK